MFKQGPDFQFEISGCSRWRGRDRESQLILTRVLLTTLHVTVYIFSIKKIASKICLSERVFQPSRIRFAI